MLVEQSKLPEDIKRKEVKERLSVDMEDLPIQVF